MHGFRDTTRSIHLPPLISSSYRSIERARRNYLRLCLADGWIQKVEIPFFQHSPLPYSRAHGKNDVALPWRGE